MTQCDKCRSSASCERPWKGMEGYLNCVSFGPVMTNGDKMRAMTDEELAEWLAKNDPECDPPEWWLDWLKQETEEDK